MSAFMHSTTLRARPHAFSTRHAGDFALLRAGRVEAEAQLRGALGAPDLPVYQVTQVHGARILDARGAVGELEKEQADALFAPCGSGLAVAVRVADCVPVLLADLRTGAVAAVHAGWRGVAQNIVGVAAARFFAAGGQAADLAAAIGPCIGACCFEVGQDVAARLAAATVPGVSATPHAPERTRVDLRRAVAWQLAKVGVATVDQVGGCTQCDASTYWSFRRQGDAAGRLIAVIRAS
jgi:hypothetical protein